MKIFYLEAYAKPHNAHLVYEFSLADNEDVTNFSQSYFDGFFRGQMRNEGISDAVKTSKVMLRESYPSEEPDDGYDYDRYY